MQEVLDRIKREDLVSLALELCSIPSPFGREKEAGDFVCDWLATEGFNPRRIALVEDRANIVGRLRGGGGGRSLIFNSHLDTAVGPEEGLRVVDPAHPIYYRAWIEGDVMCGEGVVNDKGPMAAFMLAAKAIKDCGIELKGDLWLTASPGEIGQEPVDEFQGVRYLSKEVGARFMATHGVVADFALVAEATDFYPIWVEAGKAFFKVTLYSRGGPIYTPYVERPTNWSTAPNAIFPLIPFLERFERWAHNYGQRHRYECEGGLVVARASLNSVRSGLPFHMISTPQLCSAYIDVRLLPGQNPLQVKEELEALTAEAGLNADVELYLYRRGYEAQNITPLREAIAYAHRQIIGQQPPQPHPGASSMWRDINVFNELGIPALTYGPPRIVTDKGHQGVRIDDLVAAARVYALVALEVCQPRQNAERQQP